jgi:uncharacterized membrane protein (DUF485 family)
MVLDHGPASPVEKDDPLAEARNSRIGLTLFFFYATVYAAFVIVAAFRPDVMKTTPLWGVNLAILWGFGLILGAFMLALLYGWLCRAIALAPRKRDAR